MVKIFAIWGVIFIVNTLLLVGVIGLANPTQAACEWGCWRELQLGSSRIAIERYMQSEGLPVTAREGRTQRYEWHGFAQAAMQFVVTDDALVRFDASWINVPEDERPMVWRYLMELGAPDAVSFNGRALQNFRLMTGFLVYFEPNGAQLLITIRRANNYDPVAFGEFRLLPTDRILRITRFFPGENIEPFSTYWRGFGWYPVDVREQYSP